MATEAPPVVSPLPVSSSRPSSPASPHRRRFSHIFSSFNLFSPKSRPTTPDAAPRKSGSGGTSAPIPTDEETASSVDAIVDSSTSFGSPRSLVLTPLSSTPTSPSPPPSSPQSAKLGRSLSASKAGGIGSKIGAVLRVRSLRRRREAAAAAAAGDKGEKQEADPRRHSHFREESDESGYIQDDEAATSANDDNLPRPPLQRKSSSGRMQVLRGWKDEEGREIVVKEATARRAKISQGARKDDSAELLLPVAETEHSSQNHGARRSNSQRSRSTVGSVFTEDLFYEALDSFEDDDKTPLGSERTARPDADTGRDEAAALEADIAENNNNAVDRISGIGHGNNRLSDINNYDDASLHPRVESALSSAPLSADDDVNHSSTTASSDGDDRPRIDAADPQGTITRASLAVSSENPSSAVHSQIGVPYIQEASSDSFNYSGRTAEQRKNNTRSTPEAIAQLSAYDIANIGIEVNPSTPTSPETKTVSAEVQPQDDPSPSTRGRTPSPPPHPRPPQRPSSTPPGSYTLDRDQDCKIEKDNSTLAQLKTMISHPHSASASSSSAGQPSSFPPYPYAHLYPQQQQQQPQPQPQASGSRHHHRTPHSHHGHGSGSGFAHNVPHQYQQPPQQKEPASQSPWSGTLPMTTASPAPASSSHGNASSKAQKAWWSHFNFVRAMKKDANTGDSGAYQVSVPCSA
ncbi:hypothetical protein BKA70DRAFT_1426318 [Coprinopsis sp. MPI-PUGE-AT-0042]|nr:hypothetical protein BKA70DRAFT_1426318 [Coprinopsis sp. MPI-PUGE-AT-0042]